MTSFLMHNFAAVSPCSHWRLFNSFSSAVADKVWKGQHLHAELTLQFGGATTKNSKNVCLPSSKALPVHVKISKHSIHNETVSGRTQIGRRWPRKPGTKCSPCKPRKLLKTLRTCNPSLKRTFTNRLLLASRGGKSASSTTFTSELMWPWEDDVAHLRCKLDLQRLCRPR